MQHEVWYTTKDGRFIQAWQGLSYTDAWEKATALTQLGYDACVMTPGT